MLNLCEDDLLNRRLAKGDVEGFLSAFNYNTYGATNVSGISDLIFTSDDQIPHKLAEKKRANPPPSEVNEHIDISEITDKQMHNARIK